VTSIRVDGVLTSSPRSPASRKDVTEIILNVKGLVVSSSTTSRS
jgi:DNA-directed RNA polymerase alpha subunit